MAQYDSAKELRSKKLNYGIVAIQFQKKFKEVAGFANFSGNLVDNLKGTLYIGKKKYFRGIGFKADGDNLIVVLSVNLFYGYKTVDVCLELQKLAKEIVEKKTNYNNIEIQVFVENIIEKEAKNE